MTRGDWLTHWSTYEDPLLFLCLTFGVAIPLVMWAFRTAQVSIRIRLAYQIGVAIYITRGYLLRTVEVERGWFTNATILVLIVTEVLLLVAIIRECGLFGPRRVPPANVP